MNFLVLSYYIIINKTNLFMVAQEFENGKLLMIEHPEGGIHWFTTYSYAADFIGCTISAIRQSSIGVYKSNKCKGWHVSFTNGEDVFWSFINPKPEKNPLLNKKQHNK